MKRKPRYKRPNGPLTLEWLKSQIIEDTNGCWIWQRGLNHDGYGSIGYGKSSTGVHRVMYSLVYGLDPVLHVLHNCDVPACINPEHLYQGTQQDNVRDCIARERFPDHKGKANGRTKLTEKQVKAIRKDPRSEKTIAAEYPVGPTQIGRIKRGVLWNHV